MIFLKLGSVAGESLVKGFEKHIDVTSYSFGANLNPAPLTRAGLSGGAKPDATPIAITIQNGTYSPSLFRLALNGKESAATILVTRMLKDGQVAYLKFYLKGATVNSWSQSSGGDRPAESLMLGYRSIAVSERAFDVTGVPAAQWETATWDELSRKVG